MIKNMKFKTKKDKNEKNNNCLTKTDKNKNKIIVTKNIG